MLEDALARMPHRGPMRLIGGIDRIDDTEIHAIPTDHTSPDFPLRIDGVLYASALVELGAQAAAAHASMFGMGGAHSGLVLALTNTTIHMVEVPDTPLAIHATCVTSMDQAARYRFTVRTGDAPVVDGEILLSMQSRPA